MAFNKLSESILLLFLNILIFLVRIPFFEKKAENSAILESITIIHGPVGISEDKKEIKTPAILPEHAKIPDKIIDFLKLLVQKRAEDAGVIISALIKIIPTV